MIMGFAMQDGDDPKEELSKVLASIQDTDEMLSFLRDLCSPQELTAMAERWRIVNLVDAGIAYRQIGTQIGASTATITRVARALGEGSGYRTVLDSMTGQANE